MTLQVFLAIIVGLIFGCLAGLTPGIHPNTVAAILLSISPLLAGFVSPIVLAVFIVCVAVSNSVIDAVPSIYLGAPDEGSSALSVLPGHRLLLQGKGHEAVVLTLIGSLFGLILAVSLTPVFIWILGFFFPIIRNYVAYLLILVSAILIWREEKKLWALIIFIISGSFGLASLNLNLEDILFPMFSGLFGLSALFLSIKNKVIVPKQITTTSPETGKSAYKPVLVSLFSGSIVSFLPGLGNAQAAIMGSAVVKETNDKNFLIMLGGINTVNFVVSFVSLYVLDRARNGSIVVISKIIDSFGIDQLILFVAVSLVSGGLAVLLTISLSKIFARYIDRIKYALLSGAVILAIILLVAIISGYIGLLILAVATFIGFLPPLMKIGRSHLMATLIVPVIFYLI